MSLSMNTRQVVCHDGIVASKATLVMLLYLQRFRRDRQPVWCWLTMTWRQATRVIARLTTHFIIAMTATDAVICAV